MFALSKNPESKLNPKEKRRTARERGGRAAGPGLHRVTVPEPLLLWHGLCGTAGIETPARIPAAKTFQSSQAMKQRRVYGYDP